MSDTTKLSAINTVTETTIDPQRLDAASHAAYCLPYDQLKQVDQLAIRDAFIGNMERRR